MNSRNGEISLNLNSQGRFQRQIYLFNPFKRKDGVGEVLAQNLQKVGYLGGRMWQALKSSIFDPRVFVRGQSSARQKLTVLVMAQTTRGALVKVAKNKTNRATDEVHVENQNYGLGWSEIGNYRTVTRLLSLFQSYYQVIIA